MEALPLYCESLIELMELPVVITHLGEVIVAGKCAIEQFGYNNIEEIVGLTAEAFMYDEKDLDRFKEFVEKIKHSAVGEWSTIQVLVKNKNNEKNRAYIKGTVLDSNCEYRVYWVSDVEKGYENSRLEQLLAKSVEFSPVTIVFTDLQGKIIYANKTFEEISGYTREEAIGMHTTLFKSGYQTADFYKELWATIKRGDVWRGEFLNKKKDGSLYWESATIRMVSEIDGKTSCYVAIKEDITDKKWLESQLEEQAVSLQEMVNRLRETQSQMVQQEKMASVGQLAAGVAHEINNPLGFIGSNVSTLHDYVETFLSFIEEIKDSYQLGNYELIQEKIKIAEEDKHIKQIRDDVGFLFEDLKEGLDRVKKIVQGLRNFSRIDQFEDFEDYNLNEGIQTTLIVANNEIKYDAVVVQNLVENLPTVKANGGQINQVILNLLLNAVQAIREFKADDDLGEIKITTGKNEGYVFVKVKDNGPGVPKEAANRLFEPFFTTKPVGIGTGLGLSISYDIVVNKHKGYIRLNTEDANDGAEFELGLPMSTALEEDYEKA